jgi:hypothetical protein
MYRHPRTGVELNPEGWVVGNVVPSSGGGEIVQLSAQGSGAPVMVWLRSDHLAAADIPGRLRGTLQQKILQRLDFEGYRMRPDSIQPHLIAGKQALSAVADFTDNGQPMAECLTLIFSENTRVLFFSRIPASQLTDFKPRFDKLAATAVLPQAVAAR